MGFSGAVAQLGERLLCKQEVVGSIPSSSTIFDVCFLSKIFEFVVVMLCSMAIIFAIASRFAWALFLYVLLHREEEIYLIRHSVERQRSLCRIIYCARTLLFFVGPSL